MKKALASLLALALFITSSAAEYGRSRSEVSLSFETGYNSTWDAYSGLCAGCFISAGPYFETLADVRWVNADVFSTRLALCPKMPLSTGEVFVEADVAFALPYRLAMSDLVFGASAGYRMDYASAQFGINTRTLYDMSPHPSKPLFEPVNFLYRISFNVRPHTSIWNLGGGVTDFSRYGFERWQSPLFFMDARFDVMPCLVLNAEVYVKTSGIFNGVGAFYGLTASVGLSCRF